MPIVWSDEFPSDPAVAEWWYNSLDCCVTQEVYDHLSTFNRAVDTYRFELGLQGQALDMMTKGFLIDPIWRQRNRDDEQRRQGKIQANLDKLAFAVWGRGLNPNSPLQMKEFLYDALGLPPVWISFRGERKISTNREALEKCGNYYFAAPFVNAVLALRDTSKTLSVLRTGVDPDGRMRCSYNVCGTETGRWSSSKNVYGRGSNLQNIRPRLRRMFVADPGMLLVHIDGEQAESRAVGFIHGNLFDDWAYLNACEEGDLHTAVTKMTWLNLPWTGNPKADREIADALFYRDFTYRDMAKRGGHGTNYYGTPHTMARHLKVPASIIEDFQRKYFRAFPSFQSWHKWVAQQLMDSQSITTFVGRERTFFGRPNDDTTLREAIAYEPQSCVGDLVNEGGRRVWKAFPQAQVLAQTHDSYDFQIPIEQASDLVPKMLHTFEVTVPPHKGGRSLTIPGEAQTGFNWAPEDPKKKLFIDGNPDGLRKWTGTEQRKRVEDPSTSLLDRVLY